MKLSELINDIRKAQRKETLKCDYFLNELVGKEITIVDVDAVENMIIINEDGVKKKVFTNSKVVIKKLPLIKELINKYSDGLKASVVQKLSRNGRTYIDLT